ncbi:MAG: haloacid dehalogenase-like hydrolase [Atopobiaceae bacterium]|nr:haloacid dehalogenase-like hydrolase [Atopobiaceae bacterium]
MDGQSGALFSTYLLRRGYLSPKAVLSLGLWGLRYQLHLPHRQGLPREVIFERLGHLDCDEVERIMRDFHDKVLLPRYRADALVEVGRRREEGCVTLLVSATFMAIAELGAAHLGMDGAVATRMRRDATGHFTGEVEGSVVQGEEKVRAVAAWADEVYGAGAWTLAYAYGDHHSDEELLSSAESCFAVCPGQALKTIAKRNDWPILEWS